MINFLYNNTQGRTRTDKYFYWSVKLKHEHDVASQRRSERFSPSTSLERRGNTVDILLLCLLSVQLCVLGAEVNINLC